jgi:hypothetical protein
MSAVAALTMDQNVPQPVELAMLAEQMLDTKYAGWDIPNSHERKIAPAVDW